MSWKKVLILVVLSQLAGCATTQTGKAFDLLDDNRDIEALRYFEAAASEDDSKVSAVMASYLYLADFAIPQDLDKARQYYELAEALPYGRWDQYLDYFIPIAHARILLYDDDPANDAAATDILRGERYSEFSPVLSSLATAYAFGKGVNKNLLISKRLFERAIDYDHNVYSAHRYAWLLAVHPDEAFRDGPLAAELMEDVMEDDDQAEEAETLDTLAAVLAENGRFSEAAEIQNQAIETLIRDSQEFPQFMVWHSWMECRLRAYEQHQALRYTTAAVPFVAAAKRQICEWD